MYTRRGSNTGPSIDICPNCHSPKTPNQALCTNCNTRSCPNGHVMAGTARICAICNWVDPKARTQSSLFGTGRTQARAVETKPANTCPTCGNPVEPGLNQCQYCGNLVGSDYNRQGMLEQPTYTPPEPSQKESVVVFQQSIGTHDKKRTYACPRCGSRIDNPRAGQCPNCGYVGTMQYDILQRQPQWASPPPPNTPPSRYNPPASQGFSSSSVTSVPSSHAKQPARPPSIPDQMTASNPPGWTKETTCPSCGAPNNGESRFCRICGHEYGIGRVSQKITTMSIEDRSYAAAGRGNVMTAPIYDIPEGEAAYEEEDEFKGRGGRSAPRGKRARVKTRDRSERKFPMGLLMAVMVVAAAIVALAIYVISGGPTGAPPISSSGTGNPPALSNVLFTTNADGSIQVNWNTDKPSTGQVLFCDPAGTCSWTEKDSAFSLQHSANIPKTSIKANTEYHVTVESIDQDGNTGQFESQQTFTGEKTGVTSIVPPKISGVTTVDVTDIGFVVKWTTDVPSTSQIEYGTTRSYGSFTSRDTRLKTSHTMTVFGVKPNTSYYIRVVSADVDGNTSKDDNAAPVLTQNAVAEGIQVGNRAQDFTLSDLNGNLVKLSSYRGNRMIILNFWATWCGPCMEELPYFQKVKDSWVRASQLEILAVDNLPADNLGKIQTTVSDKGITFKVLLHSTENIYNKWVVNNTIPITYFIDTQGIIRYIKNGNFANQSDIESILDSMN